jgi:hypothetical protein
VTLTFIAPSWHSVLARNALTEFDAMWSLPCDWVEAPNYRRGGWSGVTRHQLDTGQWVYVKRQQNQRRRLPQQFWQKRSTYFHEFLALQRLKSAAIPVVDCLYYGERADAAILVTLAPPDYIDLAVFARKHNATQLTIVMMRLLRVLRRLHRQRWQHGACYPAHVLVHPVTLKIMLLDLERFRKRLSMGAAARSDFSQLLRRSDFLTPAIRAHLHELYESAGRRNAPVFSLPRDPRNV